MPSCSALIIKEVSFVTTITSGGRQTRSSVILYVTKSSPITLGGCHINVQVGKVALDIMLSGTVGAACKHKHKHKQGLIRTDHNSFYVYRACSWKAHQKTFTKMQQGIIFYSQRESTAEETSTHVYHGNLTYPRLVYQTIFQGRPQVWGGQDHLLPTR